MLIASLVASALLGAVATAAPQSPAPNVKRDQGFCGFDKGYGGVWTLYNNPWGAKGATGYQCTTLDGTNGNEIKFHSKFSWNQYHGGVKAYPNAQRSHNRLFSQINGLWSTTSWTLQCNPQRPGASVVYDLFGTKASGQKFEVMLWLAAPGEVHPIAHKYTDSSLPVASISHIYLPGDSRRYDLFIGPNSGTTVYSFVVYGALVENGNKWTTYWNGDLKKFLHFLTQDTRLGADRLTDQATLGTSSFGIEASTGSNCVFSADLMISP